MTGLATVRWHTPTCLGQLTGPWAGIDLPGMTERVTVSYGEKVLDSPRAHEGRRGGRRGSRRQRWTGELPPGGGFFARLGWMVVRHPWRVIGVWLIAAVAVIMSSPGLPTTSDESSFLPSHYESI